MNVLDLFSAAAGGWSLGLHRAGFRTMAACEAVEWRRILYSQNNPGVTIYDDVRTLTAERILGDFGYLPDIIVGSPPCQDISSANTKGKGVDGERSGLYFEAIRLVGECRPRWFAFENSANLRTRGADAVLAALETLDYACWPVVVRAGDIGANHERPRSWVIGCDLGQITNADGLGRDEGWRGRRRGIGLSVPAHSGDPAQDGCGQGFPGRCAESATGIPVPPCGDAAHAPEIGCTTRARSDEGGNAGIDRRSAEHGAGNGAARNTPDTDQARQALGCMVPGVRQEEIADDGCGAGRGNDGSRTGQMGLCPADRGDVGRGGPVWSLDDLADHLRVDDGLSAWVADTRVAVGGARGTSAASLIVEAFGDAVVPQIPEAIGRAILRTEAALSAVYGRAA